MRSFCIGLIALLALPVHAQMLRKAYVIAEPLQYSSEGKFRGCGLNIKLLELADVKTRDYVAVSVNFWLDRPSHALVKTAYSEATPGAKEPIKRRSLKSSWARLAKMPPLRSLKTVNGEDGALLFFTELEPAMQFVMGATDGATLQAGITPMGEKNETVFYGEAEVSDETKRVLSECLDEYSNKLNEMAEAASPPR